MADWTQANLDCRHDPQQYELEEVDDHLYRDSRTESLYRLIFLRCPRCREQGENDLVFLVRTQDVLLVNPRNATHFTQRPNEDA